MTYRFNFFLEGTDLMLSSEEKKSHLDEALQISKDDKSLIKNYRDIIKANTRSYCSDDCIKYTFLWALAHEIKDSPEELEKIEEKNFLIYKGLSHMVKEIHENENARKTAKDVHELFKSNMGDYKHNYLLC